MVLSCRGLDMSHDASGCIKNDSDVTQLLQQKHYVEKDAKRRKLAARARRYPNMHLIQKRRGQEFESMVSQLNLSVNIHMRKLSACDDSLPANDHHREAVSGMCAQPKLHGLLEYFLPSTFEATYSKYFDDKGFTDAGIVGFFYIQDNDPSQSSYVKSMENWIRALDANTDLPALVYHVGETSTFLKLLHIWSPKKFPKLVLFHMVDYESLFKKGQGFSRHDAPHTNKARAQILSHVRTGIIIDTDEIILPVAGGIDKLVRRTQEESNEDYPYPILQVHWMSRDPRSDDGGYNKYDFHCESDPVLCGKQMARWAQNNVQTWSAAALPFVVTAWEDFMLENGPKEVVHTSMDEPTINWHLWKAGALKQWCRFDIPFPEELPYAGKTPAEIRLALDAYPGHTYKDPLYYPNGVPGASLAVHNMKNAEDSSALLGVAHDLTASANFGLLRGEVSWSYMGKTFTADQLKASYPDLKCLLV